MSEEYRGWGFGLGEAPIKTEGEPIPYVGVIGPRREPSWLSRASLPLRRWVSIRLERLADFVCDDRDTGW